MSDTIQKQPQKDQLMLCEVLLRRLVQNDHGIFGILVKDNSILCLTLERRWDNNNPNTSSAPEGTYHCVKHNGDKFKDVWEVTGVPGRQGILFHAGNDIDDTHGCILVGGQFMQTGVTLSQAALSDLRKRLPDDFTLTITGEYK